MSIHLYLPGCLSLKAKRSRIKPILARLHKEFNLSSAEIDYQDHWQHTLIACAMISNDAVFLNQALQKVLEFIPFTWPDIEILNHHLETI